MTAQTQGTLFDLEATLRARLRPEGMAAAQGFSPR